MSINLLKKVDPVALCEAEGIHRATLEAVAAKRGRTISTVAQEIIYWSEQLSYSKKDVLENPLFLKGIPEQMKSLKKDDSSFKISRNNRILLKPEAAKAVGLTLFFFITLSLIELFLCAHYNVFSRLQQHQ